MKFSQPPWYATFHRYAWILRVGPEPEDAPLFQHRVNWHDSGLSAEEVAANVALALAAPKLLAALTGLLDDPHDEGNVRRAQIAVTLALAAELYLPPKDQ